MLHVESIPLSDIVPDEHQPRRHASPADDEELARSLKLRGQLVPIIAVRADGKFMIVDGERRWRAATRLNLGSLKAIVTAERPSEEELLAIQLTINSQRRDINPCDRMRAYRKLMELRNCNATDLAAFLGVSKASVTRVMSLEQLDDEVQRLVAEGKISSSNAYALARLESSRRKQAMDGLLSGELDRDQLERLSKGRHRPKGPTISRLCCQLRLGAVVIKGNQPLTLDGLVEMVEQMRKAIRKARREGYDPKTMASMLRDTARIPTEDSSC